MPRMSRKWIFVNLIADDAPDTDALNQMASFTDYNASDMEEGEIEQFPEFVDI